MFHFSLILVAHKFVWHATFKCIAVIMPFVGGVSLCSLLGKYFSYTKLQRNREIGKERSELRENWTKRSWGSVNFTHAAKFHTVCSISFIERFHNGMRIDRLEIFTLNISVELVLAVGIDWTENSQVKCKNKKNIEVNWNKSKLQSWNASVRVSGEFGECLWVFI